MPQTFDGAATTVTRLTSPLTERFCAAGAAVSAVPAGAPAWIGTVAVSTEWPVTVGPTTQGFYDRVVVAGSPAKAGVLFAKLRAAAARCGHVGAALAVPGTDRSFSTVEVPAAGLTPAGTEATAVGALDVDLDGRTAVDVYLDGETVDVVASAGESIGPVASCGSVQGCGGSNDNTPWTVAQIAPQLKRFAESAVKLSPRTARPVDAAGSLLLSSFDKDPTSAVESRVGARGRFCVPGSTFPIVPGGSVAASAALTVTGAVKTVRADEDAVTTTPFRHDVERTVVSGTVAQAKSLVQSLRTAVGECGKSLSPAPSVGKVDESFSFVESVPTVESRVSAAASSTLVLGGTDSTHAGAKVLVEVFRLGDVVVLTGGDAGAKVEKGCVAPPAGAVCPAGIRTTTTWDTPASAAFQLGRFSNSAVARVRRLTTTS